MSGIISIIDRNSTIDRFLLHQMTESMAFRGPDARQIWSKDNIGMGHALLRTTLEQERERQPLTLDEKVWIVTDVRLDGRKDLIAALKSESRVTNENTLDIGWSGGNMVCIASYWRCSDTLCVPTVVPYFTYVRG